MSHESERCWAVVPAAGRGRRMGGGTPKQYLQAAGATLIEHSLNALLACDRLEGVVVALHAEDQQAQTLQVFSDPRVRCVIGADQRCGSVVAGLDAVAETAAPDDWVLVHDAARPCLGQRELQHLMATVRAGDSGGILAEPILDTVKQATGSATVQCTLDREALWRAQTPQMFRLSELRHALCAALDRGWSVTDEASAMELAGFPVRLISGTPQNIKVTFPTDLPLAAWYLEQRARERGES
ncbi:MAG: 2-C-methyl-D-erythritol 4-phosphate cytidylyltransferase [Halioglobus sp.]|nr:2-C-methyl-D-erythritol 4-phosphate cytidylyltransferase [Halioglobus sp.]